jgi:hypothetical protein
MQIVLFIRVSCVWQIYLMIRNMLQFNVLLDFARNVLRCPSANISVVFLQCSVFKGVSKKLEKGSCFSYQLILLIFWLTPPFDSFTQYLHQRQFQPSFDAVGGPLLQGC